MKNTMYTVADPGFDFRGPGLCYRGRGREKIIESVDG